MAYFRTRVEINRIRVEIDWIWIKIDRIRIGKKPDPDFTLFKVLFFSRSIFYDNFLICLMPVALKQASETMPDSKLLITGAKSARKWHICGEGEDI